MKPRRLRRRPAPRPRYIIECDTPLTEDSVERIRHSWGEWSRSRQPYPCMIIDGTCLSVREVR